MASTGVYLKAEVFKQTWSKQNLTEEIQLIPHAMLESFRMHLQRCIDKIEVTTYLTSFWLKQNISRVQQGRFANELHIKFARLLV